MAVKKMSQGNKCWEIKNISEQEAEILIYGPIFDEKYFDEEISPKQLADELKEAGDVKKITVRINSPGGSVFAGQAIHSILKSHKAEVIVRVDGLAASAASVVAMAGDTVIMPRNSMMMIHNPWTIGIGDENDFRKLADDLSKIRESMIAAYQDKSGMDRDKLVEMLDEETWLTAEEAVEYGLADQLDEDNQVAASLKGSTLIVNGYEFDVSKFKKKPPVSDKAGRDAGFNNSRHYKIPEIAAFKTNKQDKEGDDTMEINNIDDLRTNFPELVAEIESQAKEKGAEEERKRIQGIDEISNTIDPQLVAKAKYEEPMTAEQLAFEALKADAVKGKQYLNDLDQDNDDSGVKEIKGQPNDGSPKDSANNDEKKKEIAKSMADFINKRRGK